MGVVHSPRFGPAGAVLADVSSLSTYFPPQQAMPYGCHLLSDVT